MQGAASPAAVHSGPGGIPLAPHAGRPHVAGVEPTPHADPGLSVECAACRREVVSRLTGRCAWCERIVCAGCLRSYGHYLLVCDDCHVGDW